MRYSDLIQQTLLGNTAIRWNYYSHSFNLNTLSPQHSSKFITEYFEYGEKELPLLVNPNDARHFISHYFAHGQKGRALSFDRSEEQQLPDDRAIHTVSTFFLGLFIENCINGQRTLFIEGSTDFPFVYLWFLTALYHDYGYCVSEKKGGLVHVTQDSFLPAIGFGRRNGNLGPRERDAINRMRRDLGIDLSPIGIIPFRSRVDEHRINIEKAMLQEITRQARNKNHRLHFNNGAILPNRQYEPETIVRYYNYRNNVWKAADHGIVGGFLFFDRMVKNYLVSYLAKLQEETTPCDPNDFIFRGRHFCSDQLSVFHYISDCIMVHNIWKQPENMRQKYEEYQLTELFQEHFKPISYQDNPILFILAVTDTLEPLKVYKEIESEIVINALNIEYLPGSNSLFLSSASYDVPISRLYQKAKELETWTTVKCDLSLEGILAIQL